MLARHGLVGSMSRKGNCWDNAVMERFFLSTRR
jgi:putative transposase